MELDIITMFAMATIGLGVSFGVVSVHSADMVN